EAVSRRLEQMYPNTNEKRGVEVSPLDVELLGELRPALLTLMAAVAFVLLIACANVANLLIARSEARQREIAVRTALGAGWPRLLRQLITEGCVLTTLGAITGLLLAVVLLVGAGLMIRSVRNLVALNPGFDPDGVLMLHVSIPRATMPPPVAGAAAVPAPPVVAGRVLLERLKATPGVAAAALG